MEDKVLTPEEEVDSLVQKGLKALEEYASYDQEKIDYIVAKCSVAALDAHGSLAKLAISVIPVTGSSEITPTVLTLVILFVTYSQANKFLVALSSNTPLPVSSIASFAKLPCASSAATLHFATM